jgi:hypothetical protein
VVETMIGTPHRARCALPLPFLLFLLAGRLGLAQRHAAEAKAVADAIALPANVASAVSAPAGTGSILFGPGLGKESASRIVLAEPNGAISPSENERRPRERELPTTILTFQGDTTTALVASGNPTAVCGSTGDGINDNRSLFYKLTGGVGGQITASNCGSPFPGARIFVWKSAAESCATFRCIGTCVPHVAPLVLLCGAGPLTRSSLTPPLLSSGRCW